MAKINRDDLAEQIQTLLQERHPELQWTARYSANPYGDRVLRLATATLDDTDQAITPISWDRVERAANGDDLATFVDEIAAPLKAQLL